MIFLTVGTIFPFERLTRAVDDWAQATGRGAEVFGQIGEPGAEGYRPAHFEWAERLTPADFRARMERATLVVSHAGIGTMIDALTRGKPMLMLPRDPARREIVNDHQFQTIRRFADRPGIRVAATEADVGPALDEALRDPAPEPLPPFAQDSLIAAIREVIARD